MFSDTVLEAEFEIKPDSLGTHELKFKATNADTLIELQIQYLVLDSIRQYQEVPKGMVDGVNYSTDTTYLFKLFAPDKAFVFFLCSANGYQANEEFLMQMDSLGHFWIELSRSNFEEKQHTYQYLVEGEVTIADPYAEVVLDPNNDSGVDASVLETLPSYPMEAKGIVTAFDKNQSSLTRSIFVKTQSGEFGDL